MFSDGGVGTGFSLNHDGNTLRVLLKDGSGPAGTFNLAGGTVVQDQWMKATLKVNPIGDDLSLLIDDVVVASNSGGTIGDFTGKNHTAIADDNGNQLGGGSFGGINNDGSNYYSAFTGDIASVEVAIVPEPAAFGLIFGGLALLFVGSRRSRA